MIRSAQRLVFLLLAGIFLSACQTPQQEIILSKKSPIELRAMQSRVFDTSDKRQMLRTVVSTLQDLGYSIDKIEPTAWTVSATKLAALRMSVAIYPRGQSQLVVRSNAVVARAPGALQKNQVDDPAFYQQRFFEPLSKAIFLRALQIEDGDDVPLPTVPTSASAEGKEVIKAKQPVE